MTTTSSTEATSVFVLPRIGDKVYVKSCNAKGTIKEFHLSQGASYEVQLRRTNKSKQSETVMVKLNNIELDSHQESETDTTFDHDAMKTDKDDDDEVVHVLVPCHVDSERRGVLFLRCAQSIAHQQTHDDFSVFVGLSGPTKHRESMLNILMAIASRAENSRWYMQDTGLDARPQMEHIRHLVDISAEKNSNAYLMFIGNDDMMHPLRIVVFLEGKKNLGLPKECPFALGGKLLLNEHVSADEGQLGRLIVNTQDFDFWKVDPSLKGKVQCVPGSKCGEMDAEEYFDWMVPTALMQKFFRLNPIHATSSKYCDLRLLAILNKVCPMEVVDVPNYPWLMVHYKASEDCKRDMFDNHGEAYGNHASDQASMKIVKPSEKDKKLAQRYPLSKAQVAICRDHFESIIIQYYGWDEKNLGLARREKIREVNQSHGAGFGEELWAQVEAKVGSYFNKQTLEESKGAWQSIVLIKENNKWFQR
mmetsp:Transcript_12727/g.23862  ORF Transcript_12727/g.23862 Transcript_12727/m.23862 type:complete len:476 (+) Transcript_12727:79-1506(+)